MCIPRTKYHVTIGEELECQRERGNAADTHAVSLIERELPSATYLEIFHPSASVHGSNCLQMFVSAIVRLGQYRRAQ